MHHWHATLVFPLLSQLRARSRYSFKAINRTSVSVLIWLLLCGQLATATDNTELKRYRVWKTTVTLPDGFGARQADMATEWNAGNARFKLTFYGTLGKFPNEEFVIGPLKSDGRTATHQAKKTNTIRLKFQPNNSKEIVVDIPGSAFTLVTFERSSATPGAIYWGDLRITAEEYEQLIQSKTWSLASAAVINGEGLEGPDRLGRVFSHRYHRDAETEWSQAQ